MAIRQYIGARYVLKIYENSQDPQSANWEAGVVYEPLVMVNYNNSSYISRKTVPANIGNPVANPSYWALSGLYNGQIANIQNEINTINSKLTPINDIFDISNSRIMFIADSYGNYTDANNKHVYELVGAITGAQTAQIARGGAGMTDGELLDAVNNYSGDGSIYNVIVYFGGANDETSSALNPAAVANGIDNFMVGVRNKFPNADRIYFFNCGLTFWGDRSVLMRDSQYRLFKDGAIRNGAIYVDNSQYILRNSKLLQADHCHPNADGITTLANFIVEGLQKGVVNVRYELNAVGTLADGSGATINYRMCRNNGVVSMQNGSGNGMLYYSGVSDTFNGAQKVLVNLDETLIEEYQAAGLSQRNVIGSIAPGGGATAVGLKGGVTVTNKQLVGFLTGYQGSATGYPQIYSSLEWND